MSKYRIVKILHRSGETTWAIQKLKKHWLTGKERWLYLENDYNFYSWTRRAAWAETFYTKESAEIRVEKLIKSDGWQPKEVSVEKEYD